MMVAVLLVTHKGIATSMMQTAASIVNDTPDNFACVEIPMDSSVDNMKSEIEHQINQLDTSHGLLILTDMYGGTPSNIASTYAADKNTRLVSGLNLSMLVRIMNYRELPLDELCKKIVSGGQKSIKLYEDEAD